MYSYYSRAVSNQERVIEAPVRYINAFEKKNNKELNIYVSINL